MTRTRKVFIALTLILLASGILLKSGVFADKLPVLMMELTSYALKPDTAFTPQGMSEKPDYSNERFWLSIPERTDEADLTPLHSEAVGSGTMLSGESINDGSAPVDVFYIHGTGFLNNNSWTSPINSGTATEDNGKFSLANQASIFNHCCNIYAPHYREASIFSYITLGENERDIVLDAVYGDVARAFDYFIEHYNQSRPIVLVSHSQGTHMAMRLLRDIDRRPEIAIRVVVAYTLGSGPVSLTEHHVAGLNNFRTCQSPSGINCIVHWNTYGENGSEKIFSSLEQSICTNPLNWTAGNERAPASLNLGSVPISGAYTMKILGDDTSDGVVFDRHAPPMPGYTWAYCKEGFLYVADQSGSDYEKLGKLPDKSYHGIDFSLFHMNIRANVSERIDHYLSLTPVHR